MKARHGAAHLQSQGSEAGGVRGLNSEFQDSQDNNIEKPCLEKRESKWNNHLPHLKYLYRTTPKTRTKQTPSVLPTFPKLKRPLGPASESSSFLTASSSSVLAEWNLSSAKCAHRSQVLKFKVSVPQRKVGRFSSKSPCHTLQDQRETVSRRVLRSTWEFSQTTLKPHFENTVA